MGWIGLDWIGFYNFLVHTETVINVAGFTAVNGSTTTLEWNIVVPDGKTFLMLKIYEDDALDNDKEIVRFRTGQATQIKNPPRLDGMISNPLPLTSSPSTTTFKLTIGPLTMNHNGLKNIFVFYDNDFDITVGHRTLVVEGECCFLPEHTYLF